MKNGVSNIKLTSYDDLFGTNDAEQQGKSVIEVDVSELHEFPDHPFRFEMDAEMQELMESVKSMESWNQFWFEREHKVDMKSYLGIKEHQPAKQLDKMSFRQ